jgi:hypothetical protein
MGVVRVELNPCVDVMGGYIPSSISHIATTVETSVSGEDLFSGDEAMREAAMDIVNEEVRRAYGSRVKSVTVVGLDFGYIVGESGELEYRPDLTGHAPPRREVFDEVSVWPDGRRIRNLQGRPSMSINPLKWSRKAQALVVVLVIVVLAIVVNQLNG